MSLGVALDSLFLILFRSSGKFRSSIALSFAFRRRLQAVRHFFGFFFCVFVRRMLQLFFFGLSACVSAVWCMLQLLDLPCIWAYGLGFIPLFNPIQRWTKKKKSNPTILDQKKIQSNDQNNKKEVVIRCFMMTS